MTTTLYSRARDRITLGEALQWAGVTGVGLLTSPYAYTVAAVDHGECRTPTGAADLTGVFDARAFDTRCELRWWHDRGGRGRAVTLAEDEDVLPGEGDDLEPLPVHEVIGGQYLLWGRAVTGAPAGWTAVASRRTGSLVVPLPAGVPGGRVRLEVREYVAVDPVHGNAYVAEERLVGLSHLLDGDGGGADHG